MKLGLLLAGCAVVLLSGCAGQTNEGQTANNDGLICELKRPTGSNIPKRVCMTAEEKAAQEKAGQDYVKRELNRGTTNSLQ
ncbi:hypothetical protein MHM95_15620 [Pseudoalteromonas sp. CnMc7-15]|uniref:hypothetical protein n=1 Tax=unclassified Pseudoalteromonas TaxID=194690 RepID=UPI001EF43F33|nr:hypothetical protein [Pseudoalteromonas sp. CnMc7-15]MCG7567711.1 hypothetical protein [Pseudoalteromonas sp. CnMc7-15]